MKEIRRDYKTIAETTIKGVDIRMLQIIDDPQYYAVLMTPHGVGTEEYLKECSNKFNQTKPKRGYAVLTTTWLNKNQAIDRFFKMVRMAKHPKIELV